MEIEITHTQHDSNACQRPCRSSEPSLTAKIIQFFVATRQENISECFQRQQKKIARPHGFFVWLSLIGEHATDIKVGCVAAPESVCSAAKCDGARAGNDPHP